MPYRAKKNFTENATYGSISKHAVFTGPSTDLVGSVDTNDSFEDIWEYILVIV